MSRAHPCSHVLVLAVALSVTGAHAAEEPVDESTAFLRDITPIIDEGSGHDIGIAVVRSGAVVHTVADREIFRIASVSKIVIGLSALMFFDEHNIPLSTAVDDLVPSLPIINRWKKTHPVRLIHLLEHTSGLQEVIAAWPEGEIDDMTLDEVIEECFGRPVVRWPPGTTPTYSNFNYIALNRIIEQLSGKPFDQVIKENIFQALGMDDSTFHLREVPPDRLRPGYFAGTAEAVSLEDGPYRAAAGMYSSPRDMGRFMVMLLGRGVYDGEQVVPAALVEALQIPVSSLPAEDGLALGHGPGSVRRQSSGRVYAGHNGMIEGYAARLFYSLERGEGYAVLLNTHPLPQGPSLSRLGEVIEKHFFAPPPPPPPPLPLTDATQWEGFYSFENPRFRELVPFVIPMRSGFVRSNGDSLWFTPLVGDALEYVSAGNNQFRRPHEGEASLVFGEMTDESRYMFRLNNHFYRKADALPVVFGLAALALALVMVLSGLFSALALPFVWRRLPAAGRLTWGTVAASSVVLVISVALASTLFTSQLATSLHETTFLLAITTLAYPLCALAGTGCATRQCVRSSWSKVAVLGLLIAGGQLLFSLLLLPYGWFPLVLW